MKTTDKTDITLPLSPTISEVHGHIADHGVVPGEFAGCIRAGFESGYKHGREAGCRQGFNGNTAAVHQGPNNGAAIKVALEGKPAPKIGPRRVLLGMPCVRCQVYLLSEETHCPCCKQPRAA